MPKTRSKLARARRGKLLVAFTRPFEQGAFLGYVVDIGPKFFLMAVIAPDEFRFNGFSCLRLADVRNLSVPHKYSAFVETALKKLGERLPKKPHVVLGSLSELLLSASKHFPLVTIHRERVDPEVCYIGRVDSISRGLVALREIGPDGVWEKTPEAHKTADITRVDFGGGYENALYLVGGEPKI